MIVDDDADLTGSIKSYLEGVGCEVVVASSEKECLALSKGLTEPLDLALVDVHLVDDSDGTGLRLAASIQAEWSELPVVLVTGDDAFLDRRCWPESEGLRVWDVIFKPLGFERLLQALEAGGNVPQRLADFQPGQPVQTSIPTLLPDRWKEQVPGILRGLGADLTAESVVLFSIHPLFGKVKIVARDDPENLVPGVRPNIERSPVKDVAIEHEDVCTTDAVDSDSFPKHRWLQRAYNYRSCLAVPVHVPSEYAYALFAFHRQKEQFAPHHLGRMRLAAREAASILHVQRAERRLREMQPYELLGLAYGSMAHDLRGRLSAEFLSERLLGILRKQEPLVPEDLKEMREQVEALHERLRRAAEIVHTFRQVARSGHETEQEVDLLEVVPPFVKEMAAQENLIRREVVITGHVDAGYRVRIRPTGVKQILFNLILNAVQQIEWFPLRKKACGEVVVELDQEIRDGRVWACIRVHDNGPGIHTADFERIFELGYSTKEEGFGMGLDICRQMAAGARVGDLCGEVRVRSSILFVGTTLEACIPTKLIC